MNLTSRIQNRFCRHHLFCIIILIAAYPLAIRPFRVFLNQNVQVPFFNALHGRGNPFLISSDTAGTGALFRLDSMDISVVLGVPGGLYFLIFFSLLIVVTSPLRRLVSLLILHIGCYLFAFVGAVAAGYLSPYLLHTLPVFQHYLFLAGAFALFFISIQDITKETKPHIENQSI